MTEAFVIYLLFQMIILVVNVLGFTKIPALSIFGIIGTLIIAVPTINAFDEYYPFALVLLLMNTALPIFALSRNMRN